MAAGKGGVGRRLGLEVGVFYISQSLLGPLLYTVQHPSHMPLLQEHLSICFKICSVEAKPTPTSRPGQAAMPVEEILAYMPKQEVKGSIQRAKYLLQAR